jgi:integrase/recombinase XerD
MVMIAMEEGEAEARRVVASGPLALYAPGFARWMVARGYSRGSARHRLRQFRYLSGWIEQHGMPLEEVSEEALEAFLAARRAFGHTSLVTPHSHGLPLEYLREIGVVPPPVAVEGPLERLLEEYESYLRRERGLAARSIDSYIRAARLFLTAQVRSGELALEGLTTADVSAFLARECPKRSVYGARDLALSLRALFRYLHLAGFTAMPLQWAVPPVRQVRRRALPRGIDPAALAKLLDGCDRGATIGARDYAILLLLARLGLRAAEVVAIRLGDIDWRAGELMVRGKADRQELLPLPVDVGEALVAYLRCLARRGERHVVRAPDRSVRAAEQPPGLVDCARAVRARRDPAGRSAPIATWRGDWDARRGCVSFRDRAGAAS